MLQGLRWYEIDILNCFRSGLLDGKLHRINDAIWLVIALEFPGALMDERVCTWRDPGWLIGASEWSASPTV